MKFRVRWSVIILCFAFAFQAAARRRHRHDDPKAGTAQTGRLPPPSSGGYQFAPRMPRTKPGVYVHNKAAPSSDIQAKMKTERLAPVPGRPQAVLDPEAANQESLGGFLTDQGKRAYIAMQKATQDSDNTLTAAQQDMKASAASAK